MNATLDKQNDIHALARVASNEGEEITQDARTLWRNRWRSMRLQALRDTRRERSNARHNGASANRAGWKLLKAIHTELAEKFNTLRVFNA